MNAIHSPARLWPAAWSRASKPQPRRRVARKRTAGLVFASAILLAVLSIALIALFDRGVSAQLAPAGASQPGSTTLLPEQGHDEFYRQKLEAGASELPAQF
jgi:hypothetical protein